MSEPYPGPPTSDPSPHADPSRQQTAVLERELVEETQAEPGDHERFAHYVRKEKILESALSGEPVIALCGKVWVPGRDPKRFPICPACKSIYESIGAGDPAGGSDGSGGAGGTGGLGGSGASGASGGPG